MKALILSQPKSGTYLCANLLQQFGLNFTWMHLAVDHYDQYDKNNLEECKTNPLKFRIKEKLSSSIQKINDNEFAVGHITRTHKTEHLLNHFKKVILYRNDIEAQESYKAFLKETKRNSRSTVSKSENILKWKLASNIFILNFDDMINCNEEKINELQRFLFGEIKYDSILSMKLSIKQDSITKSEKRKNVNH